MKQLILFLATISATSAAWYQMPNDDARPRDTRSLGAWRSVLRHHTSSDRALRRKKRWDLGTFSVTEEMKPPQTISTIYSSFDENTHNMRYSLSGKGAGTLFSINEVNGLLVARQKLDREVQSSYSLMVSATFLNGTEVEPPTNITINVLDINDNTPSFTRGHHYAVVKERSAPRTNVTQMIAHDADDPKLQYGQVRYRLLPSKNHDENQFTINHETGVVQTRTHNLDREKTDTYELIIEARDAPDMTLAFSSTTTLTVSITDVNDNPPIFVSEPYRINVPENTAVGSEIFRVKTNDADLRDNKLCAYTILPGFDGDKFRMETINNTGVIKVGEILDYEREKGPRYTFKIRAENVYLDPELNDLGLLHDEAEVVIMVQDVNEPPEFTQKEYEFSVSEDAMLGFPIDKVTAVDPEGDFFLYYLQDESGNFRVAPKTGMITVAGKLDRETKDSYVMTVMAGTHGHKDPLSVATVTIYLDDVNDHPPHPLGEDALDVVLCLNKRGKSQVLKPSIKMVDIDDVHNGSPFRFYQAKRNHDLKLVNNGDNTASLHTLRDDYSNREEETINFPIIVEDSGKPRLNATYLVAVHLCYCRVSGNTDECDPMPYAAGIKVEVLVVLLCVAALLLFLTIGLTLVRRRRRQESEALIKSSAYSDDDDLRENIISYNEEGGGEEDTAAFDLSALQHDCSSSSSGSHIKFIPSTPSTKVSMVPPYIPTFRTRPIMGDDIGDFVKDRKAAEDSDESKLPYDSLRIHAYEGAGSDAGSLSSLCTSSVDSEQNYDYLQDWGPRFGRLADLYGSGRPEWPDNTDATSSYETNRAGHTLGRRRAGYPL